MPPPITAAAGARIQVLVLESMFHLGGAEQITREVFRRLSPVRFRTTYCTLYAPGPMGEVLINDGVEFVHDVIRSKRDPSALWRLPAILRKQRIDIVYLINQPLTLFWGLVAARLCRVPVVSVVHNTPDTSLELKLRSYRWLLPHVDAIVAVAEQQKQYLVQREKLPSSLITVIRNGIDLSRRPTGGPCRAEMLRSLGLRQDLPVVGLVGRLVRLKGVDVLLTALGRLSRQGLTVQCLVIGDGVERRSLENLTEELDLCHLVKFIGMRKDVADLLPALDIAVLASRTEALPMVILEYMASARPVVATEVGSVREVVDDGVTGILIPPDDAISMAQAIQRLVQHADDSRRMGEAGRLRVEQMFRLEQTVESTERLLEELVSVRRSQS